ncbi:MAG: tetratricopeptide repeat-containing glycosyltransferase family protein [bacterium]
MQKKIKFPLIIITCISFYWFFISGNNDPLPQITYTIEHYHEDGCEIYRELGDFAKKRSDYEQALKFYTKSLFYKPENLTTHDHLGIMYEHKKDPKEALKTYFKAMSINPNFLEERFKKDTPLPHKLTADLDFVRKKIAWQGQPLKNKTILVYAEKGFGDTLQFCRFIPLLAQQGATVLFKPQAHLSSLFAQSSLPATIISDTVNPEDHVFDYHVSLFSLPHVLGVGFDHLSTQNYSIKANPEQVVAFKKLFNPHIINIGIAWQGDPTNINDKNRSLPLFYFYNLSRLPGVQLYSLQKFAGREQLEDVPADVSIIDLDKLIQNFDDTAAIIENLDLVISIDSAVTHLAGALGKNVWMLIPAITDWRWLGFYEKDQSFWYKNLKKFKQDKSGQWQPLFNKITALLRREVESNTTLKNH